MLDGKARARTGAMLAALLLAGAQAADARAEGCMRPVRVAASPMGRSLMVSASGQVSGVVPEFLEQVSRLSGCRFDYVVVPRVRAHAMFERGEVDLVHNSTRSEERDRYATFIHLYNTRAMLITAGARLPEQITMSDLAGGRTTFSAVRGYNFGPAYMALLNDPVVKQRVSLVPDPDTAARMLAVRRFDAVLMSPSVFVEAALAADLQDKISVTAVRGLPPHAAGMYLGGQSLDPADRERVREAIATAAARGEYARLFRQYYANPKWAMKGWDTEPGPAR
ncbi:MAG TPA: transporter substrate-binding domain-containing protein [Pseudoduganella sp.]